MIILVPSSISINKISPAAAHMLIHEVICMNTSNVVYKAERHTGEQNYDSPEPQIHEFLKPRPSVSKTTSAEILAPHTAKLRHPQRRGKKTREITMKEIWEGIQREAERPWPHEAEIGPGTNTGLCSACLLSSKRNLAPLDKAKCGG